MWGFRIIPCSHLDVLVVIKGNYAQQGRKAKDLIVQLTV